ncbi:MAG: rhomboid family intramembrane serine protease [Pseudomonadota bacterium]
MNSPAAAPRQCPRCTFVLDHHADAVAQTDRCSRCRGLFLDPGEAAQLYGTATEPARWLDGEEVQSRGVSKLRCPDGHGRMETFRLSSGDRALDLDVCGRCKGLWLDGGEDRHLVEIVEAWQAEQEAREQAEANAGGARTYLFQLLTGLPREVYNPVRRRPWMLIGTLLTLVLVYVWELQAGEVGVMQLALIPERLWRGEQPWGVLTTALLHASLLHLLGNMYFLYIFGDNVEDRLGTLGFAVVFWGAVLVGSLLHAAFNASTTIPCVGASGGVAGLMAAYLVLFPRVKLWMVFFFVRIKVRVVLYLGIWIGYQFLMASAGMPQVAWFAHIGGFFSGGLLALALRRSTLRAPQLVGRS